MMRGLSSFRKLDDLPTQLDREAMEKEYPSPNWLATDWNFTSEFARLEDAYNRRKRAIPVNFRELVPVHSGVDRATHLLHSYPAKLLANIPIFFLNCDQLRVPAGIVLDPFCGTGTVLLEAVLAGYKGLGADANPLARLIAETKLAPIHRAVLDDTLQNVIARSRRIKPIAFTPVVAAAKWFTPSVIDDLGRLLAAIREINDLKIRRFMEVCFSNCIRKVSLADPRMSVPVRKRGRTRNAFGNLIPLFERCVQLNSQRLQTLFLADQSLLCGTHIFEDARRLGEQRSRLKVDLIITSPPYLGAQKYIRASSLSIGWLGLAPGNKLRNLERQSIGREHFSKQDYGRFRPPKINGASALLKRLWKVNPLRAHIAAIYLKEMRKALLESCKHLRKGGHFVLIMGDNSVCGIPFATSRYVRTILTDAGLVVKLELVDEIRSRGLMTKRNKTAGLISQEHIFVLRKN